MHASKINIILVLTGEMYDKRMKIILKRYIGVLEYSGTMLMGI